MTTKKASWEDRLAKYREQGSTVESEGWLRFSEQGDMYVVRITAIREHEFKRDKNVALIAETVDSDGIIRPMRLGGNLPTLITESLIGHVVCIAWVDSQDVGEVQPMKVYEVIDFGTNFPPE